MRISQSNAPYRQWRHFVAMTTPMSLKPYDKFSSISNKTMVAIFPNVCLWRRSYAQNWEVLTLKNCCSIEPPSYASTAYVVASFGLVSFLLFRKHLGNLREFFGQIVYRPPWQKITRTPMQRQTGSSIQDQMLGLPGSLHWWNRQKP